MASRRVAGLAAAAATGDGEDSAIGSVSGSGKALAGDGGGTNAGESFFRRSLAAHRGSTPEQRRAYQRALWPEIHGQSQQLDEGQGRLTVDQMCELAGVPRASYYRWRGRVDRPAADMELRDRIQRICLEHRRNYGYRRVRAELREAGWVVNAKRIRRIMREDDLLAVRRRKFIVTTASQHALSVFPNLASGFVPTGLNQLWVADLTYIRLRRQFVYLAVVLDAYSRRVVGWALSESLAADFAVEALQRAIAARKPPTGLIHHSDRGVQYASGDYVNLLHAQRLIGSMSRKGNPYDNARCESFIKTLKYEEIDGTAYADLADLEERLEEFLELYYNQRRLHSALGYLSPAAFEQALERAS